jgi:hypothetical protein
MEMDKQQEAYMESLMEHIQNVQEAGNKIGVDKIQLAVHDQSKFTDAEFEPYARYFYDEQGLKKKIQTKTEQADFTRAWLNHLHNNEHHWQYWMIPNGFSHGDILEDTVLEMPSHFALEMIADWMGASKTYTGDWDMRDWLRVNAGHIILHAKTERFVRGELNKIGYGDILDEITFNIR